MAEEQNGELEVVAEQIEQQQAAEPKSVIEDVLPEEFKGMSAAEIARIALHARKEMGRQGNELGEVRRLADELIKSQLSKPKEQEKVVAEVDIFENPKEFVRQAVEASPEVQSAKQYAEQAKQESAKQRMFQLHPDAIKISQDNEFQAWVGKSNVRKELFVKANAKYDVDAADELFSTFKELRAARTTVMTDADKAARKQAVATAGVDAGGTGERSKKIYKRADILQIMAFDKRKYEAMKDEIALAYQEGRVR